MQSSVNFAFALDLYKAIGSNNIDTVNQMLASQPNLMKESQAVFRGDTVLHCASRNGHLAMCHLFVDTFNIDCNMVNENRYTALHWAALYGRFNIVRFLLNRGAAINAVNKMNQTSLQLAVYYGHHETVELLLSKGADVNICDADGKSCLIAAREGKHEKIEKMIEQYGEHGTNVIVGYFDCNDDDEEIQLAKGKLQYLQIKKRLKSNQQMLEEINDSIIDMAQIDTEIRCNKEIMENALKKIEDAKQTIASATKIVVKAKENILSLETPQASLITLNANRKKLEEENEALKKYLQDTEVKETETNVYLDCPICLETLLENTNVFQCPNGHYLCVTCYGKIDSCPHCRTSTEFFCRSRPVEDMLTKLYEKK